MMRGVSPNQPTRIECDTETRLRFFHAFHHKDDGGRVPRQQFFANFGIKSQQHTNGSTIANRREKKRIFKKKMTRSSGRLTIVGDAQLDAMIYEPQKSRQQCFTAQLKAQGFSACRRTIKHALLKCKRAGIFKPAKQKEITPLLEIELQMHSCICAGSPVAANCT